MATLAELDPRSLIPNPRNPRFELPQLQDLIASIQAVGVLQPIIVFPDTTSSDIPTLDPTGITSPDSVQHMILIGHRRHAAALELELATIPCLIAESEAAAQQLVKIIAEAGQGVGLTALEEASAFHQLELLDWTPEQIATATARPVAKVRSALGLHQLPEQARTVAARVADAGDLDLEQIAALQQFAGDPKVMARIATRAEGGSWGFQHAIAEEQSKLERRQQLERLRAELTLAGVRIVSRPQQWGYGAREAEASTLLDAEGEPLDPEQVKARPGFAAFIDTQNLAAEPRAVIICVDPEAWGYTRTARTSYVPDQRKATADAEARRAAQQKEALATAATVRHTFLERTYGNARSAKKVYLDALRDAVRDPETIRVVSTHEDLTLALAGADFDEAATAGVDRLTRMLVARWLTASEANLDSCVHHRWNSRPEVARDYLDRLTAAGYGLSEAEQTLYDDLVAEIAEDADDEQETDADQSADTESDDDRDSDDGDSEGDAEVPDQNPDEGSSEADEFSSENAMDDAIQNEDTVADLSPVNSAEWAATA